MASPASSEDLLVSRAEAKRLYLLLYNIISSLLWTFGALMTISALVKGGPEAVYPNVGNYIKWTQTLAGLEILHSLLGIVRASLQTTFMQVASRFALVWGATHFYPEIAARSFYSSMLLAWSITEVIRYSYFALSLAESHPAPLKWLRYSAFFVLYPIGITSELAELFLAMRLASERGETIAVFTIALVMLTYAPGAPMLFKHMMAQRRKIMPERKRD